MSKPADKAVNKPRPPGGVKTYNMREKTLKARTTTQPNSQTQAEQDPPHPASIPPASAPTSQPPTSASPPPDNSGEMTYVTRSDLLPKIAARLDVILERCDTLEECKVNIANLAKFTWEAAKDDQEDVTAELVKWCGRVVNRLDGIKNEQSRILNVTENFCEQATGLQAITKELENQLGKVATVSNKLADNPTPYRDALIGGEKESNTDSVQSRVLIDVAIKAKQIMVIIKDHDASQLNPDTLKDKANRIIAKIKDSERPETVEVELITKFFNGGMLLHLNSKEAANWLREPTVEEDFLKELAKDAYVKERTYNVLLRGVPIIFEPGNEKHLREIEEVNGLKKYSLLKANWIKPESRRRRDQTHAHATAIISTVETANAMIKNGLYMCGVKIRPEKLKKEPLQCLRCRKWGHFANNCLEPEDVCGTCGENHRTNLCKSNEKKHCVSCKTNAHCSWDRSCPEFIRRRKLYDSRHPENTMVYFPTEEEWTLTTRPDRIPLEERFPPRFTVNDIPITTKKVKTSAKRTAPTKPIAGRSTQGKEQPTINQYFNRSQYKGKSKGKQITEENGETQETDEYDECFDNIENDDVERLIGSSHF